MGWVRVGTCIGTRGNWVEEDKTIALDDLNTICDREKDKHRRHRFPDKRGMKDDSFQTREHSWYGIGLRNLMGWVRVVVRVEG
jgi:hypothetical protein